MGVILLKNSYLKCSIRESSWSVQHLLRADVVFRNLRGEKRSMVMLIQMTRLGASQRTNMRIAGDSKSRVFGNIELFIYGSSVFTEYSQRPQVSLAILLTCSHHDLLTVLEDDILRRTLGLPVNSKGHHGSPINRAAIGGLTPDS